MATNAILNLIWPDAAGILQPINKVIWPYFLEKLIKKSRFQSDLSDYSSLLLQKFGQNCVTDLPLAALRFPGETALCADLCYLHPDRDCLRLFHRDLQVSDAEAMQLQASLKPLLDQCRGEWLAYSPKNWGLRLPELPAVQWQAINKLEGRSITDKFPSEGEQSSTWRRLLNEIQMSLFEHPVNLQREAAGLLPVNAVWFYGATALELDSDWQQVAGDDDLLRQLADVSQADYIKSIDFPLNEISSTKSLIVLPAFNHDGDWESQLEILEEQVFKPLWQKLRHLQLRELQLCVPKHGHYQLTSWRSWL